MTKEMETLPVDEIVDPNHDEKLHPIEKEDPDEWAEFRESIGSEPDVPPIGVRRNGHVELIDGDRRLRALRENYEDGNDDAGTVEMAVHQDANEVDETAQVLKMIEANEHRKDSDPVQRAWNLAQLAAPWLLPVAERKDGLEMLSQQDLSRRTGHSDSWVAQNLVPIRNEYPLRSALGKVVNGRALTSEDMETIDDIVYLLSHGGKSGTKVILENETSMVADEISNMTGPSLGEITQVAQKAAAEGWNADTFLETLSDEFGESNTNPVAGTMDQGALGGSDPFKDTAPSRTFDDGNTGQVITDQDAPRADDSDESEPVFDEPNIDVDWSTLVSDDDLPSDATVAKVARRKFHQIEFQDDAAVAIHLLSEVTGADTDEIRRKFLEPLVVDAVEAHLRDAL